MSLFKMLEQEEGRVAHAYQDSLGYWTIGIGRLVDRRRGGGLTNAEMDYLLVNDIAEKTAEVRAALPWFDELDEPRQEVLVAMAFQLGTNGLLQFKQTLAYLRDKHWKQAADQITASAWAKQTPARVKRLALQVETGKRQWV